MSFSVKIPETPEQLLKEQEDLGARLMMTIPYGSPVDKMQGFVSVIGGESHKKNMLPVLTLCVRSPNSSSVVSTIVFKDDDHYLDFIDKLLSDAYLNFKRESVNNLN